MRIIISSLRGSEEMTCFFLHFDNTAVKIYVEVLGPNRVVIIF